MRQVSIKDFFVKDTRIETLHPPIQHPSKSIVTSKSALSSTSIRKHTSSTSQSTTATTSRSKTSNGTTRLKKEHVARRKELKGQWTEEKKQEEKDKRKMRDAKRENWS
ncbi:hypothetical protein BELL_0087g00270 [Botrytis elliptica]|uniref:Uncharacterized protein n=1 Tax=Botrytis elliptica TaxID=278938 RepID=A0A4Z1K349_9HELO|nr:hypothetical protein BELL_0087g00270 [Botrytis elliptica]